MKKKMNANLIKLAKKKINANLNKLAKKCLSGTLRLGKINVESLALIDDSGKTLARLSFNGKLDYKKCNGVRIVGRSEKGFRLTKFAVTDFRGK